MKQIMMSLVVGLLTGCAPELTAEPCHDGFGFDGTDCVATDAVFVRVVRQGGADRDEQMEVELCTARPTSPGRVEAPDTAAVDESEIVFDDGVCVMREKEWLSSLFSGRDHYLQDADMGEVHVQIGEERFELVLAGPDDACRSASIQSDAFGSATTMSIVASGGWDVGAFRRTVPLPVSFEYDTRSGLFSWEAGDGREREAYLSASPLLNFSEPSAMAKCQAGNSGSFTLPGAVLDLMPVVAVEQAAMKVAESEREMLDGSTVLQVDAVTVFDPL